VSDFDYSDYVGDSIDDLVNHPKHYTQHPSGVECIQITEHFNFCVGNAIKYLWRAGLKDDTIQDLCKAIWYIEREIERRQRHD
jgi:hypothetical protein